MYTLVVSICLCSSQAPLIRLQGGCGRNGIITNYTVVYQLDGSPQETFVTDDNSTSLVLQGLQHSSLYHVTVAASTAAGLGPYSDAVTGRTLQRGNPAINYISYCILSLLCNV